MTPTQETDGPQRPVLTVGLVGFTAAEELQLQDSILKANSGQVVWQVGGFSEADAWLVNGSRTALLADGDLVVAAGVAGRSAVQFHLAEVDRPIAFSEPVVAPDFEPALRFSLGSPFTVHQVLARFVLWLRPLASQLCLAAQLIEREAELAAGAVYHVSAAGRLLAVVDLCGDVGVLRTALPADFHVARWSLRPSAARYIPETFERITMSMLMWQFALRSNQDLLPSRYLRGPIYFRRPPRLPHRVLTDSHLLLMRELAQGPRSFDDLLRISGLTADRLAHVLSGLYLVGTITSNPVRARKAKPLKQDGTDSDQSLRNSGWPSRPALAPGMSRPLMTDLTAPAPMF